MTGKRLYRIFATMAVIFLLFGTTLGVLSHTIDFSFITAPFDQLPSSTKENIYYREFHKTVQTETETTEAADDSAESDSSGSGTSVTTKKDAGVTGIQNLLPANGNEDDTKESVGEETEQALANMTKAQKIYSEFRILMENLEQKIASLPNKPLIVLALLVFFAIKAYVPIVPVAFTCFLSGVLLPFYAAVIVNVIGVGILFTIKFFWGKKQKTNNLQRIIGRWDSIWVVVEDSKHGSGNGNPLLLFVLRLVPSIPINPVSQLYGYMKFNYWPFLLTSELGYLIKLISFTAIGANITDPFSSSFITPIVIVFLVSGTAMFIFSKVLKHQLKEDNFIKETY